MRSPKSKFYAEISFSTPIVNIGSVTSVNGNTLKELNSAINYALRGVNTKKNGAYVTIKENKATYPSFSWVEIEHYKL